MKLEELEKLKNYTTEADLIKAVQEIDDKVLFRAYNKEQILGSVNELIKIDLLSMKYEAREEINIENSCKNFLGKISSISLEKFYELFYHKEVLL